MNEDRTFNNSNFVTTTTTVNWNGKISPPTSANQNLNRSSPKIRACDYVVIPTTRQNFIQIRGGFIAMPAQL